ncbi:mitochondrial uncoupling protein 4 isoform X1 [Sitophilus oryzae]|uniref:Mitochondrial uncoupling protein 4 isoform X1 n=2 Tax=Sitophilus oryzae TaxID=7048 RepID=A0A6J2YBG2_SITOR|nr:mitochondrial uncoupling protein 4 isoform X1 [Sitophilus oryzae]XP_030760598.1 mitochondrial uncoupling protein 4 isoform X1 [Sitophilus oryzae]XP_030760599.1 mitochondrial uncoupling protein 4 isoform X1 [Sitophilus oryzae]XP_030760600.1 mitochondrial uncoupling protein 4 isoform X1 [Sitophilus oryzae]XP_030760601.1 mitochondrial uncoupling protein 4 isoform X1 [Sitophilus oryzae]
MPPVPPAKPEFPKFVDSLWCVYAVSVVAAWNAEFLTYPLDLIKTRLQIQGELNKNGGKVPYRGMLGTAVGITKEEGIHKLWQGIHAAFARHLIYSGTRIMTYKSLKEKVFKQSSKDEYFPLWKSAICGVSAGAIAQYIASPTDLVKVQLQMEGRRRLMGLPPRVHGIFDAFKKVWASGGVRGLWKGSVPNVQRAALVNLGDLTTYDLMKRSILRHTSLPDNHLVHVLASCGAGFVAASMGTPADVIKTRVMNQPLDDRGRGLLYTSSLDCLRKTIQSEGFGALYKGFIPIWMRMAPWSLSFWLTYEEVVSLMGAKAW